MELYSTAGCAAGAGLESRYSRNEILQKWTGTRHYYVGGYIHTFCRFRRDLVSSLLL